MDTDRRDFIALTGLGVVGLALSTPSRAQEGGSSMIIITGKADIPTNNRDAFLEIGKKQVTNSLEEDGNLSYAFYEDAMVPNRFFFFEEWKDQAAVDFHFKQTYCLEFIAKARQLASAPPEIKIHHVNPPLARRAP
jgi:quinol monooxygenase YgiN